MGSPPIRQKLLVMIPLALIAFAQTPKPAPAPKSEISEIKAIGCVRKAAKGPCLLLVTLDGKTTYSFIAAPKPDLGSVITIDGKPHNGPDPCKQGLPIDIIDWQTAGGECLQ